MAILSFDILKNKSTKLVVIITILALFLFVFVYYFFLINGVPFTLQSSDDLTMIYTAKTMSFQTLIYNTFFEKISLGGTGGGLNPQMRPFRFLLTKIIFELFGENVKYYYLFTGFFFSQTICLIYLFSKDLFKNKHILFLNKSFEKR